MASATAIVSTMGPAIGLAMLLPQPAFAQAQVSPVTDTAPITATGTAQSPPHIEFDLSMFGGRNPFLIPGEDAFTVGGEVAARGGAGLDLGPGTRLQADGSVAFRQYSQGYGNFVTGGVALALDHRHNEYLSLHTDASFERILSIEELTDSIDSAIDPLSLQDRTVLGQTVTWHSDALTTVSGRVDWNRLVPHDSLLLDKTSALGATFNAQRQIDSLTTLGAVGVFTWTKSKTGGDPNAWSVRATASRRMGHGWRAEVELGIAQTSRLDTFGQRGSGGVQFAGSGQLCHEPGHVSVCINASIEPVVTSFRGIQRESAVGATLNWRTSEYGTITASADYRRTPQLGPNGDINATRLSARYDHRLDSRMSVFGGVEYRRRTGIGGQPADSAVLQIGITLGIPRR
ncbi:hypothetical protein EDF56_102488 [Novosphingobium sp. PhB165]|uniref:hypothetical protein n=1 Tax=Novosphingobium sp. PhB165 TaxID=2485105 RepID=UPI0010435D8B|nr:hypothetical protein [Novosphingobium sp. PhB165]TCM20825.1 hypothetical protein EDF56_102488 [Novosphingobium sp. PhB165]